MIGVELVLDRKKKTPAPAVAAKVVKEMADRGVLLSVTGVHNCVLRITPPLTISEQQVDDCVERLDEALAAAIG